MSAFRRLSSLLALATLSAVSPAYADLPEREPSTPEEWNEANNAQPSNCSDAVLQASTPQEKEFFEDYMIEVDSAGNLVFSESARKYFIQQRSGLLGNRQLLTSRNFEMEHMIDRMELALMAQTHVITYGAPGANKTGISESLLYMLHRYPYAASGNPWEASVFNMQLNQQSSVADIRGYIPTDRLRAGNAVTLNDVVLGGSMVTRHRAQLDELEKANPQVFSALLDLLNERVAKYGPITIEALTQTMFATMNMSTYEFLAHMKDNRMYSTGEALLDRIPMKILASNWLDMPDNRDALLLMGEERAQQDAMRALTDPLRAVRRIQARAAVQSRLTPVDMPYLGYVANFSFYLHKNARKVIREVMELSRKGIRDKARADLNVSEDDFDPDKVAYQPTTIYSNRNMAADTLRIIKADVLRDLMLIPRELLPDETLLQIISSRPILDRLVAWRLAKVLVTAAPGDAYLAIPESGAPTLEYNPRPLENMTSDEYLRRREMLYTHIRDERNILRGALTKRWEENMQVEGRVSDVLSTLMQRMGMPAQRSRSLENAIVVLQARANPQ